MTRRYVAGLLFDESGHLVVLITKRRPAWQAGRLNGVGGKIEAGESPLDAMRREFREEAGLDIAEWRIFAELCGENGPSPWRVWWFTARVPRSRVLGVRTVTDEEVAVYPANMLATLPIIGNLSWLVPLALDPGVIATVRDEVSP